MVYVRRWESFVEASRMLYDASPDTVSVATNCTRARSRSNPRVRGQCRFCIRWRYDLGLMVLKITDDKKVSQPLHRSRSDSDDEALGQESPELMPMR